MWRRVVILLCLVLTVGMAGTASAALIAHWPLNGNAKDAADGHDGVLVGGADFVKDPERGTVLRVDGITGHVVVPHAADMQFTRASTFTLAAWVYVNAVTGTWQGIMSKSREQGEHYGIWVTDSGQWMGGGWENRGTRVPTKVWVHVAHVHNGPANTSATYVNGVIDWSGGLRSFNTAGVGDFWIGGAQLPPGYAHEMFGGLIDDVRVYNHVLTQAEIQEVMIALADEALAHDPIPADEAVDVPVDISLGWAAGELAAGHDVYLGTAFDDVNAASRANPKSVLASQGQADTTFAPQGLEFGRTYYWRVDEVNAAPDNTIFKGQIWSFTTEPYAYPIKSVTATASSSSRPDTGPQNTVNGSGLNAQDQHSVELTQMWMSGNVGPHWIQYEFDKVYKLDELWVWNSNQMIEPFIGFGAKTVKIEYSTDGATWATLEGVPQFGQGTGAATYATNTTVDFGGVTAKFVKLTIVANWSGAVPQTGLSEVRFFAVPVQARAPVPADGATDVSLDVKLNWRPGREATSHKVFFGKDSAAVAAGTAASSTVTEHSYAPAAMEFGIEYFWKVDEVGGGGPYPGEVWSFMTQEFETVEAFEAYNDDDNRIYDSWIDGVTTQASGSTVGYLQAPFAETTIKHGGKQSMPLAYDNSKAPFFSEAEREFETAQNWTGSGARELCVWTRGHPAPAAVAVTETGGKMTLTGAGADIWNNSDEFTYAYKILSGDGSIIARVTSNGAGSNTWAKGGVMIRDSLKGGSTHAMMIITGGGGNGASFQYRPLANAGSSNNDSSMAVAPPYWVKIERSGDTLTGFHSADGKVWSMVGQTTITMEAPVLIGICVTSHVAGVDRTFQFENIATTGTVTGNWQGVVINTPEYNDPADMYLTVVDSAGKTATASSATAVTAATWTRWVIPMSDLAGVNFAKVKKLVIGVDNKAAPTAGGKGMVFIDDIGYGRSAAGQ